MSGAPDLGAVFDEHVASEFDAKDLDATMRTMVDEPYVWHVPSMAGAAGGAEVRSFYGSQFIGHTPDDAVTHPIARRVAYEHIYWDQATVLVQVGLLDPAVLPATGSEQAKRLLELAGEG